MPKIEKWDGMPEGVRGRLIERMRDRPIGIAGLNQLRLCVESKPEVPEGDWYKDFGRSRSVAKENIPRHFCFVGRPQRAHRFDR